jgi:5,10-methylene-tetrahydrofolate dehydrogenase/methenyl tetrahydrofolate cyclohydrolase
MQGREPLFVPCTPLGCIELLERTNTPIAGRRAAVIGRSNIVGMPVALLLIKRNATVTLCHSATQNMEQVVREADIVIAAAGQAEMIKVSCSGQYDFHLKYSFASADGRHLLCWRLQ